MRRSIWVALAFASLVSWTANGASAQVVPGFGDFTPLPQARERPDPALDYKVLYVVQDGARTPSQTNLGLDRAAKLANMLAAEGVPAGRRHIVVVVLSQATETVLSDAAYAARHEGQKNPNAAIVAALIAGGVSVRICGQAMTNAKITPSQLAPGVQLDVSALVTSANLQLKGYAVWIN